MNLTLRTNRLPAGDAKGHAELNRKDLPKAGSFEVVVVGGGTGGAPAAIVAAQEGLRTAVIEPQGFLGGIGTGGGIHVYYHGLQTGIQVEIDRRTDEWNQRIGGKAGGFHPEAKKLALQEMADAAGVTCFYRSYFAGVAMDGERIVGVVAEGERGLFYLEAKVVVDASGDADVAAAAGAPFHFGREGDRAPQPYSLAPGLVKNGDTATARNFDAGYVDPTNALDQSRAQREGRTHLYRGVYDEANRFHYVSPILGLRESRFIDAEYVITLADQRVQRRFPDVIARAKAHYDNHAFDYENESADAREWVAITSNWHTQMCHDVPYRCMLPKRIENLIVACRAVGMTHDAHNLFRMQRDIQALGEAAAVAARVALRGGTSLRHADVKAIQKRLVERGALPEDVLAGHGAGTTIPRDEEIEAAPAEKLFGYFGGKREPLAINEFLRRGEAAFPELRVALQSPERGTRFLAAVVLGLQGIAEGVPELQAVLKARWAEKCEAVRSVPRWLSVLNLLDRLGLRETGSLPLVLDLLRDAEMDVHKATAAIRALGRHATAEEAVPAIRALLERADIETRLVLQRSTPGGEPATQDRRFVLDLAAADVLAQFGAREPAAARAERYVTDERALVRKLAREVLEKVGEPALAGK